MFNLTTKEIALISYGAYLILLSLVTFIAYYVDKQKAKKGAYRTKEFFGGAFGGYPAMLIFRHKTKGEHWYFTFINVIAILLHVGALVAIYFFIN